MRHWVWPLPSFSNLLPVDLCEIHYWNWKNNWILPQSQCSRAGSKFDPFLNEILCTETTSCTFHQTSSHHSITDFKPSRRMTSREMYQLYWTSLKYVLNSFHLNFRFDIHFSPFSIKKMLFPCAVGKRPKGLWAFKIKSRYVIKVALKLPS